MKLKSVTFFQAKAIIGQLDEIPEDMLRYDYAFANDKRPGVVAFPRFRTKTGDLGGKPTFARWRSFCVRLDPILTEKEPIDLTVVSQYAFQREAADWYMCRHPTSTMKGTDYTTLEKVPLTRFLDPKVKDTFDLDKVFK